MTDKNEKMSYFDALATVMAAAETLRRQNLLDASHNDSIAEAIAVLGGKTATERVP